MNYCPGCTNPVAVSATSCPRCGRVLPGATGEHGPQAKGPKVVQSIGVVIAVLGGIPMFAGIVALQPVLLIPGFLIFATGVALLLAGRFVAWWST